MRTRFITTLLLLFANSLVVHPQDIYRFKYRSPYLNDTTTYNAFFSLSANGTGFVRVLPDNNRKFTAEMEIQERFARDKDEMPDTTYLVYEGNPKVVLGDTAIKLSPVIFWFKINRENFYDPWAVTLAPENSTPVAKNVFSLDYIKSQDLSKKRNLITSFFADSSTNSYYKNISRSASKGIVLSPDERKITHMYLIVVASTNDPSLKGHSYKDAKKIINTFSEIAYEILGLPKTNFHLDTIFGNNYSRANIEMALKNLPSRNKENNLFIFYYSGHGYRNPVFRNKDFPFFDLRDPRKAPFEYKDTMERAKDFIANSLNVQDIYDTIIKKGARFNLVLSDCCNNRVGDPKQTGTPTTKKKGITRPNAANVRELFMNKKQPVRLLMTAASKEEKAVITPSFDSYFTYFFIQSLTTYLGPEKGYPAWSQVLGDSKLRTINQVNGLPCKEKINCPKQTPMPLY